jgi:hypothetical protein
MRWMVALIWRLPPRSRRCRLVLPELTGIGATPAARASLASLANLLAPATSPTSLAAVKGPKPGSVSSCGATVATSPAISRSSALIVCESSRMRRSSSRAMRNAHRLLSAREAPGDARRPAAVEQRAGGQFELGPEIVQMPLQRVVERDALADQALAVIDQQPQVELRTFQLRRRQRIQAFAQRRPRDRDRVDAVGLPAGANLTTRRRHQPGRDPQDALSTTDQKPLKRSRDMPTVLQRPDPLAAETARPTQQRCEPPGADLDRLLAHQLARRR